MEGKNNTVTVKIDNHVSCKGRTKRRVQDEERECLLEGNSEAESWIDQGKRRHESGKCRERKTSTGVSIYRVPESIKKTKREAYDPVVLFLGPYHHEKYQEVTEMDDRKLQAVDRTLERLPGMTIEGLVEKVGELTKEIRDCYEDSAIEWDDDTLAWMMTMDVCYILDFLRMPITNSSVSYHIRRQKIILDILKLENQIPLCILKMILELELKDYGAVPAFLAELLVGIGNYFQGYPFSVNGIDIEYPFSVKKKTAKEFEFENVSRRIIKSCIEEGECHLLNLSRKVTANFSSGRSNRTTLCGWLHRSTSLDCWLHRPTAADRWPAAVDESLIPSAANLQRAGIKLKPSTDGKFCLERRCFGRSTLLVPKIIVERGTEIFLRNLVAFEECKGQQNSQIQREISNHICKMDNLIHSKEDVELLQRANIIKNDYLETDEIAQIFNDLCMRITHKDDFEHVLRKSKTFEYVLKKIKTL